MSQPDQSARPLHWQYTAAERYREALEKIAAEIVGDSERVARNLQRIARAALDEESAKTEGRR